jgi:Domain of unknown function (DUF4928)
MNDQISKNPLLAPILHSFDIKRGKKTGAVPRSWLLVLLRIFDQLGDADHALTDDDLYTYDYTLKKSRANAIPELLRKHGFPVQLGMGHEGITTRGAPGLRVFRAIEGGAVLDGRSKEERKALIKEAIEILRLELSHTIGQKPVKLEENVFQDSGDFVGALLRAVENRSNGRVEQALVGAKLQLRYPTEVITAHPTFAGDAQTGRECDFATGNMRVIVSVTPKDPHFDSALFFAREGRQVFLVVGEKAFSAARRRIAQEKANGPVRVSAVQDYVAGNMAEIARDRKITPHEMCIELVTEYNKRIINDYDPSLQVVMPESTS